MSNAFSSMMNSIGIYIKKSLKIAEEFRPFQEMYLVPQTENLDKLKDFERYVFGTESTKRYEFERISNGFLSLRQLYDSTSYSKNVSGYKEAALVSTLNTAVNLHSCGWVYSFDPTNAPRSLCPGKPCFKPLLKYSSGLSSGL